MFSFRDGTLRRASQRAVAVGSFLAYVERHVLTKLLSSFVSLVQARHPHGTCLRGSRSWCGVCVVPGSWFAVQVKTVSPRFFTPPVEVFDLGTTELCFEETPGFASSL